MGHRGRVNCNFGSIFGRFGSGRGFNRRGAPIGFVWAEFQLKRSHGDPFHAQNNRLCATGSNSGAPRSQEISLLTSRSALEQRSVSWGPHLSGFCFELSHGDLFRDQHVPHIELNLFLLSSFSLFVSIIISSLRFVFFVSLSSYRFFLLLTYYVICSFIFAPSSFIFLFFFF